MIVDNVFATLAGRAARSILRIVIAYENFTAGKDAMDACNRIGLQLGSGVELRNSMWKFDVLRHSRLNQIAVDDAADAEVIIVASGSDADLPPEVKQWVHDWVPRKQGQPAALVALLAPSSSEDSSRACAFLKHAAARAQITFLSCETESGGTQVRPAPESIVPGVWQAANRVAGRAAPEGWGLND